MASIEYLDDERKKLWDAILKLEKEIKNRSSDDEKEAKQNSRKTSEYRNKSLESKELIEKITNKAQADSSEIQLNLEKANHHLNSIIETSNIAKNQKERIAELEDKIESLEDIFENKDHLSSRLNELEKIQQDTEQTSSKITAAYNSLLKRKKEIDDLYFEIIGIDTRDEDTGETSRIDGLRDELEKAFEKNNNEIESLKKEIETYKKNEFEKLSNAIQKSNNELQETKKSWQLSHDEISNKIRALLPDALTAGLSHAFSEKKNKETIEGGALNKNFYLAIFGLVLVSLIPFSINIYMLNDGKALETIISNTPRIVIGILPLYIPFLWLAYFSNKRINLSKRLVEEYTHKEVLSKTFEGLSQQIEQIENGEISKELRVKLLFNLLEVSSENPGKLISDYNKADYPIMDVLEKSSKLSNAVESLQKIPGLSKIAKILDEKSSSLLEKEAKKIEKAIDSSISS